MHRTAEINRLQPARSITNFILVLAAVISALLVNETAPAAQGDLININFGTNFTGWGPAGSLVDDPSATQTWNNITNVQINRGDPAPYTTPTLVTSQGIATDGATMTWNADGYTTLTNAYNAFTPTPYQSLMRSYIFTYGGSFEISFSGLDAGTYDLYVYTQGDTKSKGQTLDLTIGGVETKASASNGKLSTFNLGQNYLTATVTTDASGNFSFDYSGLGNKAVINGLQLYQSASAPLIPLDPISGSDTAPVPEPASMVLIGVGGVLAAFRRFIRTAA